jgi:adenine-specific DNA methylase
MYASQALSGEFYGTWGFSDASGKLITLNIQEKSVELNAYKVDNTGIIDFDNFPEGMLDNLESEVVVISKYSALFPHKDEKSRAQLKFQPIDTTFTQDFYLYLLGTKQLLLKAVAIAESPTLSKIFGTLKSISGKKAHAEAEFYKIR